MLLTLTNPVENITHVSLAACEEDDPDDINRTAQVVLLHVLRLFSRTFNLSPGDVKDASPDLILKSNYIL